MGGGQVRVMSQKQAEKMIWGKGAVVDRVQCCREVKMRPKN